MKTVDKFKRMLESPEKMSDNIVRFYRTYSTVQTRRDGHVWYDVAYEIAFQIANKYGFTIFQAAGVLSALSPAVLWQTNIKDAETVCAGFRANKDTSSLSVSTYGQNKDKAYGILDSDGSWETVSSFFRDDTKTQAFFHNIVNPHCFDFVTIDRHALAVALNSRGSLHLEIRIREKQYRNVSEAYRIAAKKLDMLFPLKLQAIVWIAYRDNFGGRWTGSEDVTDAQDVAPF